MEQKMKYCVHCGKQVLEAAVICPHCGCAIGNLAKSVGNNSQENNEPSTGLNVISFLIPLVGLILYLVYIDKAPNKAKEIGKFALIGLAVGVVAYLLLVGCASTSYYY